MSKYKVNEAIEKFGGEQKVADMLGVDQSRVHCWRRRGWVGLNYVLRFAKYAEVDPIDLIYERLATPITHSSKNKKEL